MSNNIIDVKERQIEIMTKNEMYEKYSCDGMPLNNARLYYCIEKRLDIKYIKELIDLGVDLEYYDDEHKFPLWEAIKHKCDIEVIRVLKEAYYDERDLLDCFFSNPNIECLCCEIEYNPDNEELFYINFEGTIIEYLHILYFEDKEYLIYFELFDIAPYMNIKDIWCNDSSIRTFYELYLKYKYISDNLHIHNIKHEIIKQKYPEYINYKNYKVEFINYIEQFIDNITNIEICKHIIDSIKDFDELIIYDIYKLCIKLEGNTETFTYICNNIFIPDIYTIDTLWENKNTITGLYIYKIHNISDLIRVLYNLTKKEIYQQYYNILNIELIDSF